MAMITHPEQVQHAINSKFAHAPPSRPPTTPPPFLPLSTLDVFHWPPGSTSNIERGVEGGREGDGSSCRCPQIHSDIDLAKIFDQDCLSRGRTWSTKLVISPKRLQIHAPYFTGIMLIHMHIYTSKIEEFIQSKLALCLIEFDFCLHLPTFWHC